MKSINELLEEVTNGVEFNYDQMLEIRRGFKYGLSMEQVLTYAKPEFNNRQMFQIRKGFETDLSMEKNLPR